jgi:hypothetical protein
MDKRNCKSAKRPVKEMGDGILRKRRTNMVISNDKYKLLVKQEFPE